MLRKPAFRFRLSTLARYLLHNGSSFVSKPALGRGLGNLMKETPTVSSSPPEAASSVQPANISPGMATLLRGNREQPKPEPHAESKPPAQPNPTLPEQNHSLLKISL